MNAADGQVVICPSNPCKVQRNSMTSSARIRPIRKTASLVRLLDGVYAASFNGASSGGGVALPTARVRLSDKRHRRAFLEQGYNTIMLRAGTCSVCPSLPWMAGDILTAGTLGKTGLKGLSTTWSLDSRGRSGAINLSNIGVLGDSAAGDRRSDPRIQFFTRHLLKMAAIL